jgi:hypothetical protein
MTERNLVTKLHKGRTRTNGRKESLEMESPRYSVNIYRRKVGQEEGKVLILVTGTVQELKPMTMPVMITTKNTDEKYSHI